MSESNHSIEASENVQVIVPPKGWIGVDWGELWRFRELFLVFVWRDVKVKYKQTLLGAVWAILVPFFHMVIFAIIFGAWGNLPTNDLPGPIFYYAGLLPWTYFATALAMSSNSLVGSAHFLTKIYFPRMIVPASPCFAGLVDFVIASSVLALMLAWYGLLPSLWTIFTPLLLLVALGTALGAGVIFAALNVKYRDIRYAVPFLIQMWMYVTVIFPFNQIPERYGIWRYLYGLNPMAGVVEGFRWCLLNRYMAVNGIRPDAPWLLWIMGVPAMLALLFVGLYYFRRMERMFADIV